MTPALSSVHAMDPVKGSILELLGYRVGFHSTCPSPWCHMEKYQIKVAAVVSEESYLHMEAHLSPQTGSTPYSRHPFFLIFVIICMNTLMLEVNKSTVLFFAFQKLGPGMAMQEFPEIG